ncbi:hypothetical protein DF186_16485, partial [Enterococcus hirae]
HNVSDSEVSDAEVSNAKTAVEDVLRHLQSSLRSQLSVYELPAVYVPMAQLPRAENDSVDTAALPDAGVHGITVDTYVAPRNAQEETLCA